MRLFGPPCTVLVSTLAGCSLIYNPNNLPGEKIDAAPMIDAAPPDVPPDMPTDTNVDMPSFMTVGPRVLLEGQGTGGSRPAILSIVGGNFGPDATIAIEPTAGPDATIAITVDNANIVRSPSGTALAVPVTLPVDVAHGSAGAKDVPLTITVIQMGASGPIMLPITGQVSLRSLPELTAPIADTTMLAPLYSQVHVTSAITFATSAAVVAPAVIRAVGSIDLGDVHADGGNGASGPGGRAGGAASRDGKGLGGGKAGSLLVGGSGGGFGAAGGPGAPLADLTPPNPGGVVSGDDPITNYGNNTSGGGGGNGAAGGGGGGTLEISAGGTLSVAKVSANGGPSSNGGGGSGGAIVLRAGAAATLKDAISATGGGGGNAGGSGGLGRLRYDLAMVASTPVGMAVTHAGVAFDSAAGANPLITTDAHQHLRVLSEASSTQWTVTVRDAMGTTTSSSMITFASTSASIATTLSYGYNRVCVSPPLGNPEILESTNCIDLAYVP